MVQFVDLWILYFVGAESGMVMLSILRLFRLMRLLRLVRLLHLLRPLWLLCFGLYNSISLLFWAIVMLSGLVFMGAILMVELVGKHPDVLEQGIANEEHLMAEEHGDMIYAGGSHM